MYAYFLSIFLSITYTGRRFDTRDFGMSDAALSDSLAAGAAATAAPPPLPALVVRARSVGAVSLLVVAMVAKMDDRWVGLMGTAAVDTASVVVAEGALLCLDTVVLCVAEVDGLLVDGGVERFERIVGT